MVNDLGTAAGDRDVLDQLAMVAEDIPEELAPIDAAAAIICGSLDLIGADVGFVATAAPGDDTIDVRRVTQYSNEPVHLSFPVDAPYPLAATIMSKEPLFIASNHDLTCNHPGLVRVESDDHACATIPLVDREHLVAAMNIAFEDPHEFSEGEVALLEEVGRHCAAVLTRSTP